MTEFMATEVSVSILIGKLLNLQRQGMVGTISKLQKIREMLKYAANKKERDTISEWMSQLLHSVYQAEDSIDTFLVRTTSPQQRHIGLIKMLFRISGLSAARKGILFSNEMERFVNQVRRLSSDDRFSRLQGLCPNDLGHMLHDNAIGEPISPNGREGHQRWGRISDYLDEPSEPVEYDEQIKRIRESMDLESLHDTLIVVGSEGSGKTALVRAMYDRAKENDVYGAWVHASREYVFRDLLIDIWKQIWKDIWMKKQGKAPPRLLMEMLEGLPEDTLASGSMPESLLEKVGISTSIISYFDKYLVVLDDVCQNQNIQLVHRILQSIKDCVVFVTTRCLDLANDAGKNCLLFQIRPLTRETSWELFLREVGALVDRSDENLKGKIYEITKGSPLAIILLRRMLFFTESSEWSSIINLVLSSKDLSPSSPSHAASEDVRRISENFLALSNHALPSSLKPLLLYFGIFPKAFEIRVRRLLRLWLAEGLITSLSAHEKKMEPEDRAERYLEELVTSNLVEVVRWSSDGSPKTCRVPGMLYDIFFPKDLDIGFYHVHNHSNYELKPKFEVRRVAEYLDIKSYPCSDPYIQHLRSYVSFNTRKRDIPAQQTGEFLNKIIARKGFQLLRVLDLEGVFKPMLPETLGLLLHLVYIGLRWTFLDSLPMSVGNLPCLEILDVKHTNITTLPNSIWRAENLRHLYLNNIRLDMPIKKPSDRFLRDLKTLSGLLLGKRSSLTNGLDRLRGLRKLGLTYHSTLGEAIAKWISQLTALHSLKLRAIDEFSQPSVLMLEPFTEHRELSNLYLLGRLPKEVADIRLPSNLKVLSLSVSQLREDPMPTLGQLPQLNILRLFSSSYLGKLMTCDHGSFPKLRVLKLWTLKNLEEWKVMQEALPHLQELEIRCCEQLKEVIGLKQVSTLKELILTNMPEEFVKHVNSQMDEQVHITVNEWQFSLYGSEGSTNDQIKNKKINKKE